jgi:hypothetical protein
VLRKLSTVIVLLTVLGAQGCGPASDDDRAVTGEAAQTDVRIDGDALMRRLVVELGADPSSTVRSALDRAANHVAALGVEPYPASCTGKPERQYWNGDHLPFSRYGVVGVADLLVLDATTQGRFDTSRLAEADVRSRAELARAIAVLAKADSPALLADGVAALTHNPQVKGEELRALLAFSIDIEETKRFRDAAGSLRVPDLDAAPDDATIFARLRQSPILSFRQSAAEYAASGAIAVTKAEVDQLLADPSYRVRAAAGGAFWRGSDTSPARQAAILASFASDEAKAQMRADTLREDYGVREEDAAAWSNLPGGIERRYLEAIGSFTGYALEHAPDDADVSVLVEAAASLRNIADLVESAIDAVTRSTVMSRAAKASALGKLRAAAADAAWRGETLPSIRLSAAIAEMLLDAPLSRLGSSELVKHVDDGFEWALRNEGWDAVRADLDSPDATVRLAAIERLALTRKAIDSAGFQITLLRRAPLDAARRAALLDAAEAMTWGQGLHLVFREARAMGADPRDLLARVRRMIPSGPFRPWTSLATAYLEAARDPALTGDEIVDAVVHFTTNLDPIAVAGTGPGSPPVETVRGPTFGMLELLEDPRVSDAARERALGAVLVGPDGLRSWLLPGTSTNDRTRRIVANIVRPHLVRPVPTCWRGTMQASSPRPAILFHLLPYVVQPPTTAIDPKDVLERRVRAVREASKDAAPVAPGTDLAALFDELPKWRDAHLGLDMWAGPERSAYQKTAAEIAGAIVAAPDGTTAPDLALLVRQLGFARDFRSLPARTLGDVEARIARTIAPKAAAEQHLFFLHAMRGEGYDALAVRFRATVGFRWDLADAARPQGEKAALETLLASVGRGFATLESVLTLASQSVTGADVSPSFRQGLLEYGAETERFWETRGRWSTGLLPIIRAADPDLSFLLRGDAMRPLLTMSPSGDEQILRESSLYGTVASDPRLPPDAAVSLAWRRLAHGKIADLYLYGTPRLHVTVLVDTVLGVLAREDVSEDDKRELGKALRWVLD